MEENKKDRMQELSKKRLRNDDWQVHETLSGFAEILGAKGRADRLSDYAEDPLYTAFCMVCRASKIRPAAPDKLPEENDGDMDVDCLARVSQLNYREVLLSGDWYREDSGPILAYFEEDGRPAALIPKSPSCYILHDIEKQEQYRLTEDTAGELKPHGVIFYRPFPSKKLTLLDIMKFAMDSTWRSDAVKIVLFSLVGALIGMIVPKVTQQVFDVYIPGGEVPQLVQIGFLLIGFLVGKSVFELTRSFVMLRIEGKMEASVQSAVWDRLLGLPTGFFRDYTAGELVMRAFGISQIRQMVSGAMAATLLTGVFSLVYLFQVVSYGRELTKYAVIMVLILMVFSYFMGKLQMKYEKDFLEITNKTGGLVLQLIQGIAKFRVAGAENRAFKQWADLFARSRKINYRKETITTVVTTVTAAAPLVFNLVFYIMAVKKGMELDIGRFIAFTTAFGTFSGAMISIINVVIQINVIKPTYDMARPIIETLPEYDEEKEDPGEVTGAVRMENVSFRYEEDAPLILKDINIDIKPGEYVGLVGSSGSGKSTLFRMLLGFETPEAGQVYYDDKDLADIDIRALRKQLGVVMQNAQLLSGDIYNNIIGANTKLTVEDAMEAARKAGMEEDIKAMPMGLHTVVSEGAGTLSGGQRQRLLIARAIVNNPKILYFDEATSALDNRTQKIVQDSLDGLNSTRIVIAHRLSTIINCDRILVMDKGRIAEEGTYDELMEMGGIFAKMAERQIV